MKKVILSSVLIMATAFPVYAQQPIELIQRQQANLIESIQREFTDTGRDLLSGSHPYFGNLDWNFATLGLPSPGYSLNAALEGNLHDFSKGENQKIAFHVGKNYYLGVKLLDDTMERDALTSKEQFFELVAQKVRLAQSIYDQERILEAGIQTFNILSHGPSIGSDIISVEEAAQYCGLRLTKDVKSEMARRTHASVWFRKKMDAERISAEQDAHSSKLGARAAN